MTNQEIFSHVDHTLLRADAGIAEILVLCHEAQQYGMASVCIPPSYVAAARKAFPKLRICTVIGFPLGYSATEVKKTELLCAVSDGADELDAVINIGNVKNGHLDDVESELRVLRNAAADRIFKVIIETCCLTHEEKLALCGIVTRIGADYIKTSTGFGSAGAQLDDIALMRENIGAGVKIKASGGIRTRDAMEAFLKAGCSRLGTSSAVFALV